MSRGLPERLRVRPMGSNGRPSCRYCHGDVRPPKQSYCSPPCMHEFRLLNEPEYARACVFARDRGVCAGCGVDTVEWYLAQHPQLRARYDRALKTRLSDHFPVAGRAWKYGAWEMDHIVEVARGGESDLSNLQTLCALGPKRGCHYEKTRRFAAERAEERRGKKRRRRSPNGDFVLLLGDEYATDSECKNFSPLLERARRWQHDAAFERATSIGARIVTLGTRS